MDTIYNFAFCLVMDGAGDMTISDAEYNIKCWKEEKINLPKGITAVKLVHAINKVNKYLEDCKNNV